jgi:hypothetical protein
MQVRRTKRNTSPLPGTTGAAPGVHLRRTAFPDLVRLDTPGLGVPADSSEALIPLPSEPSDSPLGRSQGLFLALLVHTESVVLERDKVGLSSCQASGGVSPTVDGSSQLTSHGSCKGPLARWTPSLRDLLRRSDLAKMAEKAPQGPKWAGGPN